MKSPFLSPSIQKYKPPKRGKPLYKIPQMLKQVKSMLRLPPKSVPPLAFTIVHQAERRPSSLSQINPLFCSHNPWSVLQIEEDKSPPTKKKLSPTPHCYPISSSPPSARKLRLPSQALPFKYHIGQRVRNTEITKRSYDRLHGTDNSPTNIYLLMFLEPFDLMYVDEESLTKWCAAASATQSSKASI